VSIDAAAVGATDLLQILTTVDNGECVVPGDVALDAAGEPGGQVLHDRRSPVSRGLLGLPVRVGRKDKEDVVAHVRTGLFFWRMQIPAHLTYATIPAGLTGHGEGPGTVPSQTMPGPPSPVGARDPTASIPPSPGGRDGLVDVLARSATVPSRFTFPPGHPADQGIGNSR
jgi:hypothetical protein